MSFRDNLQHLRATHAMTQEQLALMLGVSRQSVTKWEAEKSYPEMDKLLKLCQIFDVTLDDLVQGDLTTSTPTAAVQARAAILREAAGGPPQDVCGYDEHMRAFAWKIAWGVGATLVGVALLMAVAAYAEAAAPSLAGASLIPLFAGIAIGLGLIVTAAFQHTEFGVPAQPSLYPGLLHGGRPSAHAASFRMAACGGHRAHLHRHCAHGYD